MLANYATLGIEPGATLDEVKSAYRKIVKQYHPDRNKNDPTATVKLTRATEAYDAICDRLKNPTFDFSIPQGTPGASSTSTQQTSLTIVDFVTPVSAAYKSDIIVQFPFMFVIPRGFEHGELITGSMYNKPGNLAIRMLYRDIPDFTIKGRDLHTSVRVRQSKILAGKTIRIPNHPDPDGKAIIADIRVTDGQVVRIAGSGLPIKSGGYGDLYVTVNFIPEEPYTVRTAKRVLSMIIQALIVYYIFTWFYS